MQSLITHAILESGPERRLRVAREPDQSDAWGIFMATKESKRCSRCGEVKPLPASFSRRSRSSDGYQSECKSCDAAFYAAFRAANPDRTRVYSATWRAKLDPEATRAYFVEYQAANAERIAATRTAWRAKNAAHIESQLAAGRARKRGVRIGDRNAYTAFVRHARAAPYIPCHWCGKATKPGRRRRHIDHIIPLAKGGADAVENLCVSCQRCNCSKGAKMPEDFTGQSELRFA